MHPAEGRARLRALQPGVRGWTGATASRPSTISCSYSNNMTVEIVVDLPHDDPEVDSVTPLWEGANWHEREAYDMFGIIFKGHPRLERILLPARTTPSSPCGRTARQGGGEDGRDVDEHGPAAPHDPWSVEPEGQGRRRDHHRRGAGHRLPSPRLGEDGRGPARIPRSSPWPTGCAMVPRSPGATSTA